MGRSLVVEGLFEINVATLKDAYEGGFPELMD
jgi:hypothetical protein